MFSCCLPGFGQLQTSELSLWMSVLVETIKHNEIIELLLAASQL